MGRKQEEDDWVSMQQRTENEIRRRGWGGRKIQERAERNLSRVKIETKKHQEFTKRTADFYTCVHE